jgi:hypothetical protein
VRTAVCACALATAPLWPPSAPPGGTVGPPPTTTVHAPAAPMRAAAPVRVRSAAIGLDAPLVPMGLDADGALDVVPSADVGGWYAGGPTPGEAGPAVLAAHVDWNRRPGPFRFLRELAAGELVSVDRADGSVATFEVQAVRRYAKDAFPTDEVYADRPDAVLRLVTCGGVYDRGARSYRDNVVAYAALVAPP